MSEQEAGEHGMVAQIKDMAASGLDAVAGLGTSDKLAASAAVVLGKAQQAVGEAVGSEQVAQAGEAREFAGQAEWVAGDVRQRGQRLGRGVRWLIERSADTLEAILYPDGRPRR
jgi:uncharacterized protein YjbJ (UPF0337 family)